MLYLRLFLALGAGFFTSQLYAQGAIDTTIYSMAEQMPQYPGGNDSLLREIAARVDYPVQCSDSNIQGKVYLRFVVNTDGSISELQAVKSPHPLLSAAAMEATRGLKKFAPGMQQGKPVRVWCSVPVSFKVKTFADKTEQNDSAIISIREYFQGGADAFDAFIKKNLSYPTVADSLKLEALILIKCKFDSTLKVLPHKIMNDPDSIFSKEVLRLLELMPAFNDSIKKINRPSTSLLLAIPFSIYQLALATESMHFTFTRGELVQESYYNLGVRMFRNRSYNDAVKAFTDAITLNPRDADAFYNRGMVKIILSQPNPCDDFKRAYLLGALDSKVAVEQNCQ